MLNPKYWKKEIQIKQTFQIPHIPIDREDLQFRTSTGYCFNSSVRDLLADIQI